MRAVVGVYEDDQGGKLNVPRTVFKTLDQDIKVGDFVLVPSNTRHKMTVNKIVEVDIDPDLESTIPMQWVIGRIDRSAFEAIAAEEQRAIDAIKAAEKTHAREELRKKMLAHVDETKLQALQISQMGTAPIEAITK
ncbi:hypothetical protein KQX64_06925 [Rhodopseudomonas palustris]|nr:hypothetical protein KQX64_06925 [Rhodopseudomonas palustris]